MKVALVNTNRYLSPPVIPIGLEYLILPLENAGHDAVCLDLTFSPEPATELASFLEGERPDAVGFSVRNVDSALFGNNEFFLDGVRELVTAAKDSSGAVTMAGGSATLCAAEALREFLGVDHLVTGPGENALPEILAALEAGREAPVVVRAGMRGLDTRIVHRRGERIDYGPYLEGGHPAGIEFRKGCYWDCPYCVERKREMSARKPNAFVREAEALRDGGVLSLFFCDSEVNLSVEGTVAMLSALRNADLGLKWTGYFRPVPFDGRMAQVASESGCESLTLSVASAELSVEDAPYTGEDVRAFCSNCREAGIKVAVDLLVGLPGESWGSIENTLALLEEAGPDTVGVNPHLRLYEGSKVTEELSRDGRLPEGTDDNPGLLRPVFHCEVDLERLEQAIEGSKVLRLEGGDSGVNYQRI